MRDVWDLIAEWHHTKAAAHDVSGEPRNEQGEWTLGSGSFPQTVEGAKRVLHLDLGDEGGSLLHLTPDMLEKAGADVLTRFTDGSYLLIAKPAHEPQRVAARLTRSLADFENLSIRAVLKAGPSLDLLPGDILTFRGDGDTPIKAKKLNDHFYATDDGIDLKVVPAKPLLREHAKWEKYNEREQAKEAAYIARIPSIKEKIDPAKASIVANAIRQFGTSAMMHTDRRLAEIPVGSVKDTVLRHQLVEAGLRSAEIDKLLDRMVYVGDLTWVRIGNATRDGLETWYRLPNQATAVRSASLTDFHAGKSLQQPAPMQHSPGQPFKGPSGHWFVVRPSDHHVVPYKGPGSAVGASSAKPTAPATPEQIRGAVTKLKATPAGRKELARQFAKLSAEQKAKLASILKNDAAVEEGKADDAPEAKLAAAEEPKGPLTRLGRIWHALFGKTPNVSASGKNLASPLASQTVKDVLSGKTSHNLESGGVGGSYEDTALTSILHETDRSGLPKVVPSADLDKLVNEKGWIPMYRAMSKAEHLERFKTGDLYNGSGIYGNGTYTAKRRPWQGSEKGALDKVKGYGAHKMRMAVPPNARIVSHAALEKERSAYETQLARDVQAGKLDMASYNKMRLVVSDLGRFAALRNYDMIDASTASGAGYCVVLNRSMLAVQKENVQ